MVTMDEERVRYFLRQYRKSLLKHSLVEIPIGSPIGSYEAKLASLNRKAMAWMKKAVRAGYDHATMLHIYHRAMN